MIRVRKLRVRTRGHLGNRVRVRVRKIRVRVRVRIRELKDRGSTCGECQMREPSRCVQLGK